MLLYRAKSSSICYDYIRTGIIITKTKNAVREMRIEKKVIAKLEKCYSVAPLYYQGREHFLVAAEKKDRCILFDMDGNPEETVWEGPGGVMTMVQIPGSDGQFLAIHQFFSPNEAKEAKLVAAEPSADGKWNVKTIARLPFVHRFDIVTRNHVNYLIACTLKSGHEYEEDWRSPGRVYAARLPETLDGISEENPLGLRVICDSLNKNHGYCHTTEHGVMCSLIASEDGVFRFTPPENADGEWQIEMLFDLPASDAVLTDFDGDGEKELALIHPFHGDEIRIYKNTDGTYQEVYRKSAEFAHAIFGGIFCGRPSLVIGSRGGKRELFCVSWNQERNSYETSVIDEGCGAANIYHFVKDGKDILIAANREINEVAMYTISG